MGLLSCRPCSTTKTTLAHATKQLQQPVMKQTSSSQHVKSCQCKSLATLGRRTHLQVGRVKAASPEAAAAKDDALPEATTLEDASPPLLAVKRAGTATLPADRCASSSCDAGRHKTQDITCTRMFLGKTSEASSRVRGPRRTLGTTHNPIR